MPTPDENSLESFLAASLGTASKPVAIDSKVESGIDNQELYEIIKLKKIVQLSFPELDNNKEAITALSNNILNSLNVIKSHDKKLNEAFDGFDNFVIKMEIVRETNIRFYSAPAEIRKTYTNFTILDNPDA